MMTLDEFLHSEVARNHPYMKEHSVDAQSPFRGSRLAFGGPRSVQRKGRSRWRHDRYSGSLPVSSPPAPVILQEDAPPPPAPEGPHSPRPQPRRRQQPPSSQDQQQSPQQWLPSLVFPLGLRPSLVLPPSLCPCLSLNPPLCPRLGLVPYLPLDLPHCSHLGL